ncbi:RNA polymerase sigma factor SigZ [Vallitalea okinawensis]|uniref:RNA polymerase sigma factor SigZ n=1 Tax=Vallitalea okinawensis TaxID=2078660 RepID=UPI001300A499|nr:RNA polymerase sigma factor SigZ [Vallitalea okinawensis]
MDTKVTRIWNELSNELYKYINSKVKNKYDSEDILQEVFIKIQSNIDQVDDQSKLKSWIYKITKNTMIDYYRKKKDISVDIQQFEEELDNEKCSDNMNKEISRCVGKMISELPQKYQQVVELYDIKGMKHKEIAEELGISVSCSKMRVHRSKVMLKEILLECCDFQLDTFGNIIDYKQKIECRSCHNNCE